MNTTVSTEDIVVRLLAAMLAGVLIGFDRGRHGHAAGVRTTILLCVAACGAMIASNLTLTTTGKTETSFVTLDPFRLPLGILTGIGFIGAGAILKRGRIVSGVTTAATLWLVTVVGLVLGAGYFLLAGGLVIVALVTLMGVVHLESLVARDHIATLIVELARDGDAEDVRRRIEAAGYRIKFLAVTVRDERQLRASVTWRARQAPNQVPALVEQLSSRDGILAVVWEPQDPDEHG